VLILEGDNPLGRARRVGDDEAHAWNEFAGMPLDLAGRPARPGQASGLIGEIGVEPPHKVRGTPDESLFNCSKLSRHRANASLN